MIIPLDDIDERVETFRKEVGADEVIRMLVAARSVSMKTQLSPRARNAALAAAREIMNNLHPIRWNGWHKKKPD